MGDGVASRVSGSYSVIFRTRLLFSVVCRLVAREYHSSIELLVGGRAFKLLTLSCFQSLEPVGKAVFMPKAWKEQFEADHMEPFVCLVLSFSSRLKSELVPSQQDVCVCVCVFSYLILLRL